MFQNIESIFIFISEEIDRGKNNERMIAYSEYINLSAFTLKREIN